jgi:major vault protein
VVRDEQGDHVREAVTLERLEYCILLDEDGNKRFVQRPRGGVPAPTETFVSADGQRKFQAPSSSTRTAGIYVKVIAPYEEDGRSPTRWATSSSSRAASR